MGITRIIKAALAQRFPKGGRRNNDIVAVIVAVTLRQ
jgi:hypothetical protein